MNEPWHENGCGHFGWRSPLFCRGILFDFPPGACAPPGFFSGILVRSIRIQWQKLQIPGPRCDVPLQATFLFLVLHNATHLLILQFTCDCHQGSFSNYYATMSLSYPILATESSISNLIKCLRFKGLRNTWHGKMMDAESTLTMSFIRSGMYALSESTLIGYMPLTEEGVLRKDASKPGYYE